ncbi:MAG: ribonuclease Z [Candidatus Nezhaarchaeota archaeon]|nr:ribonuclease Z [Candidatus Nezhaarchaeota archaeon]
MELGDAIEVVFLGTSGSIPTPERGLSCIAIKRKGEVLLFDCGEGCQRQLLKAGIGFVKKLRIFISHLHGDHVLGLAGLLQSMGLMGREEPLPIYGPRGLAKLVEAFKEALCFKLHYAVEVYEVREGVVYEGDGYKVKAVFVDHSVPTLAYMLAEDERPGRFSPERAIELGVPRGPLWKLLQMGKAVEVDGRVVKPEEVLGPPRRGLKIVYSGDTGFSKSLVEFARGADLLIHEATLDDSLEHKAIEEKHSTARQAATVAKLAGVKKLVLTHISPRYQDASILKKQAEEVFPNAEVAYDFLSLSLAYED